MTNVGGHSRFRGAGTQWKTSWRTKVPYSEMFFFEGFNTGITTSQWYQLDGGVPIVPANGAAIGVVVGLAGSGIATTPGYTVIAKSGNVANEGWLLTASLTALGAVEFTFTVYDGVGVAATVTVGGGGVVPVDDQYGITKVVYPVAAYFVPPGVSWGANGAIALSSPAGGGTGISMLGSAYLNSDPFLRLGVGAPSENLNAPNGIHGLVVAEGIPDDANPLTLSSAWAEWVERMREADSQCVGFGNGAIVTLVDTNGWRANNPALGPGDAPNPLLPFIGADNLVFEDDTHSPLEVTSASPVAYVFDL